MYIHGKEILRGGIACVSALIAFVSIAYAQETAQTLEGKIMQLPVMEGNISDRTPFDWLLNPERSSAGVYRSSDGKSIIIANGMVSRTLRVFPNLATTNIVNRMLGESMLRAVSSEGAVWIDGKKWEIGGLEGQPERGYLKDEWTDSMEVLPESFIVEDFQVRDMAPEMEWDRCRWALNKEDATGKEIVFTLRGRGDTGDIYVKLFFPYMTIFLSYVSVWSFLTGRANR